MFSEVAAADVICNTLLGVCLAFFMYTHAHRIRSAIANMADSACASCPQTPGRKLFKAARATPPVRKQRSTVNTPLQTPSQSTEATPRSASTSSPLFELPPGSTPRFVRKASTQSQGAAAAAAAAATAAITAASRSSMAPSRRATEDVDIVRTTLLAPLTSKFDVLDLAAASDSSGGTPIGLIDNDVLTPIDVAAADGLDMVDGDADAKMTGAGLAAGQGYSTSLTGPSPSALLETSDDPFLFPAYHLGADLAAQRHHDDVTAVASKPSAVDSELFAQSPAVYPSDASTTEQPTDIARYFANQGNPELSEFVKALTAPQQCDPATAPKSPGIATTISSAHNSEHVAAPGSTSERTRAPASATSNPFEEQPTADELAREGNWDDVRSSSNNNNKTNSDTHASQVQELGQDCAADETLLKAAAEELPSDGGDLPRQTEPVAPQHVTSDEVGAPSPSDSARGRDIAGDHPGVPLDPDESARQPAQEHGPESYAPTPNITVEEAATHQEPRTPTGGDLTESALQKTFAPEEATRSIPSPPITADMSEPTEDPANDSAGPEATHTPDAAGDHAADEDHQPEGQAAAGYRMTDENGTVHSEVDNMGKPATINRQVEIPFRIREQPPTRMDMPEVEGLPSTSDLPDVDNMDDPPEEFLDPAVHTQQSEPAVIDPIPAIRKVSPITSDPPRDLPRLAHGLGGRTVDEVGNIVDEAGKVLGHATGDLPAMVGRKVAQNGEIYGDSGELIGYVIENFTLPPPPGNTPMPGGLSIDTGGNIIDRSGNIVGKMNKKPGSSTAIAPFLVENNGTPKPAQPPKTAPPPQFQGKQNGDATSKPKDGEQEKEKEEEEKKDGVPADIFLDVKSTTDGIQLTIRIPTVFKQETRETKAEAAPPPPSSSSS